MTKPIQGFSLLELLVVIAIMAILLGVGIPGMRELMGNAARREAATGLYSSLNRARYEAVARNTTVSVCPRDLSASSPRCSGSANWLNGWIVYTALANGGINAIEVQKPVSINLRFKNAPSGQISFDPSGRVTALIDFRLCASASARDQRSRLIRVRRSGGVTLSEDSTCV